MARFDVSDSQGSFCARVYGTAIRAQGIVPRLPALRNPAPLCFLYIPRLPVD